MDTKKHQVSVWVLRKKIGHTQNTTLCFAQLIDRGRVYKYCYCFMINEGTLSKCTLSTMVMKNALDLCWMGMWILGWYVQGHHLSW